MQKKKNFKPKTASKLLFNILVVLFVSFSITISLAILVALIIDTGEYDDIIKFVSFLYIGFYVFLIIYLPILKKSINLHQQIEKNDEKIARLKVTKKILENRTQLKKFKDDRESP